MQLGTLLRHLTDRIGATVPQVGRGSWTREHIRQALDALLAASSEPVAIRLGRDLLAAIAGSDDSARASFFSLLAEDYDPDPAAVVAAAQAFADTKSVGALRALTRSSEPRRQAVLRRLNLVPGGTAVLVGLRANLLDLFDGTTHLQKVDDDLLHMFRAWFNTGFLVLRRIDWNTPARILEKIIAYEAVHHIRDWDDLRRRLEPADRLCFAFFHPAMPDEPLIFVEVALCKGIAGSIDAILAPDRKPIDPSRCDSAIFYSISNCQRGLAGVSFGNVLIKMVASEIGKLHPTIRQFATLSPIPGFRRWLEAAATQTADPLLAETREALMSAVARYLLAQRQPDRQPIDPVARFHLGNGALLHQLNWAGDSSTKGLKQSFGIMANYLYDLTKVDQREAAYAESRTIDVGRNVPVSGGKIDAQSWFRRFAGA